MKRVLFICNLFSPANNIAAIRPTKLAKYLSGYSDIRVTVVAQQESLLGVTDDTLIRDIRSVGDRINIYYVPEGFFSKRIRQKFSRNSKVITAEDTDNKKSVQTKKANRFLKWLKKAFLFIMSRIIVVEKAKKTLSFIRKEAIINNQKIDTIITFGPNSSDFVGKHIKSKRKSNIFWIADFRDPVFSESIVFPFKKWAKSYSKRYIKNADAVVAVSPGYLKSLNLLKKQKQYVLTNGFDKDDARYIDNKTPITREDKLTFCCVGALYEGKRKLDPLFTAISDLALNEYIDINDIEIIYAGTSEGTFLQMASRSQCMDISKSLGCVTRIDSLRLQSQAHILLLPTWSNFEGQDIVPGKFLEYMIFEKPIIAIVSGLSSGGFVSNVLKNLGIGFAYEEAKSELSMVELQKFIISIYVQWKKNGYINLSYDKKGVSNYDYKEIAKKYRSLIIQGELV